MYNFEWFVKTTSFISSLITLEGKKCSNSLFQAKTFVASKNSPVGPGFQNVREGGYGLSTNGQLSALIVVSTYCYSATGAATTFSPWFSCKTVVNIVKQLPVPHATRPSNAKQFVLSKWLSRDQSVPINTLNHIQVDLNLIEPTHALLKEWRSTKQRLRIRTVQWTTLAVISPYLMIYPQTSPSFNTCKQGTLSVQ